MNDNRDIFRALVPTNRELKEHLNNLRILYARKLASTMPSVEDRKGWDSLACWTAALKEQIAEWLEKGDGIEWLTKRQWVMVLIAEAAALHQEVTKEEK